MCLDFSIAHIALTFTGRSRIRVIPGAVSLAANDPLTLIEISRITGQHHHGLIFILHAINKPPPPMIHRKMADVRAGHSWRTKVSLNQNLLI